MRWGRLVKSAAILEGPPKAVLPRFRGISAARRWLASLFCLLATPVLQGDEISFSRDIRPILNDHCFACHGADAQARQADLRLDVREAALESAAVVPGEPDQSSLVERIFAEDESIRMPPAHAPKTLSEEQKQLLRRWVESGAVYEQHWAWQAPRRAELPGVQHKQWPRQELDHFILERLEQMQMEPAPEADLASLVRRASLDLTGLLPTPEELQEVLQDPAPDRYERFVDRKLATPQWGEHRARYWLDYARYADTHGIHFDNYREMWSYRDWVIDAFNRNLPFDRFTREQLAGDLLPEPELDQRIATGFHRCNITTNEGGAIDEEYLVLYARDRVETTAAVWMGLTAGCAVCHDHKYDPMTQRDFYSLAAFFNNTTQAAMDGNRRDTAPVIPVPLAGDRARYEELQGQAQQLESRLSALAAGAPDRIREWMAVPGNLPQVIWQRSPALAAEVLRAALDSGSADFLDLIDRGNPVRLPLPAAPHWQPGWTGPSAWQIGSTVLPAIPEGGDFDQHDPFTVAVWIKPGGGDQGGAWLARMDRSSGFRGWDGWLQNGRVGMHLIHHWPDNALKVMTRDRLPEGRWSHVAISSDGSGKAAGMRIFVNGQPAAIEVERDTLNGTTRTGVPLRIGAREHGEGAEGTLLNDLRIMNRALQAGEAEWLWQASRAAWLLPRDESRLSADELQERNRIWLEMHDPDWRAAAAEQNALAAERQAIEARGTVAHVMQERNEAPVAWVLRRGEYTQRGEQVTPATPEFLPPMLAELPRNRAGLAEWLLAPDHPLTARVTVNRFWQEVFGQGIVRSSGDFGTTGELPSHPALLDWLAVDFREHGWDVKRLFRQLLTSATYRQAAMVDATRLHRDPENRLLSRGPRYRMDAEMIRDLALSTSGLLVPEIGGPSVRPYQPQGVWEAVAMPESNTRNYQADSGAGLYRRSMYTFWKRAAPPASMEIFNAPSRETCTVVRERTNTPLQALVTLNDPQFIEAAKVLAANLLAQSTAAASEAGPDQTAAFQLLGGRLLCRPFAPEELPILADSLNAFREHFRNRPEAAEQLLQVGATTVPGGHEPVEHAAWTLLVNQVMNLDEALNK